MAKKRARKKAHPVEAPVKKREGNRVDVTATDIGTIQRLTIPLEPGKVTYFCGVNGSGKSTALECLNAAATGRRGKLTARDGKAYGKLSMPGRTYRIGARISLRKEKGADSVTFAIVEDSANLGQLLDPGIKDPVAADQRRLEALLNATGATAAPVLIEALIGRELLAEFVREKGPQDKGLVAAAKNLKLFLAERAREAEDEAERNRGGIDAIGEIPEDVELEDPSELLAIYEKAQAEYDRANRAREQADEALAALDELSVPDVDKEHNDLQTARHDLKELKGRLEALNRQIHAQEIKVKGHEVSYHAAVSLQHNRDQMRDVIDIAPQASTVEELEQFKEKARIAHSEIVVSNNQKKSAMSNRQRLQTLREARDANDRVGRQFRAMIARIPELFGVAVGKFEGWSVDDDFRLCVNHRRGNAIPFAELSPGERIKLVVRLLVSQIEPPQGEIPILPIPQEIFESMDLTGRRDLLSIAGEYGYAVVTARAAITQEEEDRGLVAVLVDQDGKEVVCESV